VGLGNPHDRGKSREVTFCVTLGAMKALEGISSLTKETWRRLEAPNFPFFDYEFLCALEMSGAVGAEAGWLPQLLFDEEGATPLYIKNNSYGEYIFDWAWAEAYHRNRLAYYPKVVASAPFTPATGPKFLFSPNADRANVASRLIASAKGITEAVQGSSLHYLFLDPDEVAYFAETDLLVRHSFQYHWRNHGYSSFEDFLGRFKSRKRKQIHKERREVATAGLDLSVVTGESITEAHALLFYEFYLGTVGKKGAIDYLNLDFFRRVFSTMKDRIVLFLAHEKGEPIAGVLYFEKGDALFGRYWGATKEVPYLHFELSYYQPIQYAISKGLKLIEGGAQGEHKIARGFQPELTYSAHWIRHPAFREGIARFIDEEKRAIQAHFREIESFSPYHGT